MSTIPVERTGTPWWVWLLGALLLAALLWWLVSALGDDDAVAVVDDPDGIEETVVLPPVEETALDMSNLYVTRVTGDRTFFVAPSEAMSDDETLVLLDQNNSPSVVGIEGQVDINPGQRISLSGGVMEPLGDATLDGMGLSEADVSSMTSDTEVIRVDGGEVNILSAPMGEENVEVGA
ncbi:MAG: hypothetical protein Rubg2KO_08680 [Rubricoccaceae bacterium]